jgi:hypothetical protein
MVSAPAALHLWLSRPTSLRSSRLRCPIRHRPRTPQETRARAQKRVAAVRSPRAWLAISQCRHCRPTGRPSYPLSGCRGRLHSERVLCQSIPRCKRIDCASLWGLMVLFACAVKPGNREPGSRPCQDGSRIHPHGSCHTSSVSLFRDTLPASGVLHVKAMTQYHSSPT